MNAAWILGKLSVFECWASYSFVTAVTMTRSVFCVALVSELCSSLVSVQ